MGMFDSVIVKCPKCYEDVEIQSKAGICVLATYFLENPENIPDEILADLDGSDYCEKCQNFFTYTVPGHKNGITLQINSHILQKLQRNADKNLQSLENYLIDTICNYSDLS